MHLRKIVLIFGILFGFLLVTCEAAKISLTEKLKLGNDLTPLGAVMAGNDDGSIPPWTGGIKSPPIEYKKGDHHPDHVRWPRRPPEPNSRPGPETGSPEGGFPGAGIADWIKEVRCAKNKERR